MTENSWMLPEGMEINGGVGNPENRSHFMVLRPVGVDVRISIGGHLLASSNAALYVLEVGKKNILAPMIYVPQKDLRVPLSGVDKTTHCAIKGDATYYAYDGEEVCWGYLDPPQNAIALLGHIAFWPQKASVTLG